MDGSNKMMIQVWVLFVAGHGGWFPIMELQDEASCRKYEEIYSVHREVECKHLQRYDGHFRPKTYKKSK
jgi:hypothetical protein